jgi:hypothetical protein
MQKGRIHLMNLEAEMLRLEGIPVHSLLGQQGSMEEMKVEEEEVVPNEERRPPFILYEDEEEERDPATTLIKQLTKALQNLQPNKPNAPVKTTILKV